MCATQCSLLTRIGSVVGVLLWATVLTGCDSPATPSAAAAKDSPVTATSSTSQAKRTNRLAKATSPYLVQHAHNPVDWYEWGPEALEKARKEDKPIFLSIGYAACHWCHVMAHECFENDEIAAVLNEHFVSIKVDREERPDIDEIYMQATMALNQGRGGWPMSLFLTPDLKPFFAGTYIPAPSFLNLCNRLSQVWISQRDQIDNQAAQMADYLRNWAAEPKAGEATITRDLVTRAAEQLAGAFDATLGGMSGGGTNKFPPSMAMDLMLREYHRTGTKKYLDRVNLTLENMAYGGIYDQLGGGIHRYSTDVRWFLPHFEKMLYDQALVSDIYLDAYQLTRRPLYGRIAREILDYCLADLRSPEGAFYSTRDADSEGLEGKFYVWTADELRAVLGEADAKLFSAYYNVAEQGNWKDTTGHAPEGPINILHITRPLEAVAKQHDIEPDALTQRLAGMRTTLLAVRAKRVAPGLDDKTLTAWNGMLIHSLARAYRVLGEPRYRDAAVKATEFVLTHLRKDGRLLRTYRNGNAHLMAYLDDYAHLIEALITLYETTFDVRWLDEAVALNEVLIRHYFDETDGGFFYTADDHETLLTRTKDPGDGAVPSGNSVQAMNLLRLAILLDRPDLRKKADSIFRAFQAAAAERPGAVERLLCAVDFNLGSPKEIAIVGKPGDPATEALIRTVYERYLPNKVVALIDPDAANAADLGKRIPLLAGKVRVNDLPAAYVCQNYTCKLPVTRPEDLVKQLD